MNHHITNANIKEWARDYDGPQFDGILCDPPYELGFMGKSWDSSGIAFDKDMWADILKLLKPGGHLLAFSGSRTYHRMAVAIEDAGFEIRDMIEYVYGSGFPKSLNLEKQMEKMLDEKRAKQNTKRGVRPMPDTNVPQTESINKEFGEVLQSSVSEQSVSQPGQPPDNVRTEQPSVEGRSNTQATKGELQRCPLCEMPAGIFANGSQGRLHNGTPSSDGSTSEQNADTNGGGTPHRPQTKQQRAIELEAICNECRTQAIRGARGIGSALKPAHEPICMARKPLDGTIGQNYLKHGTGGLNIDGSRVVTADGLERIQGSSKYTSTPNAPNNGWVSKPQTQGRFPANLIHDGSDEVEAVFPQTKAGVAVRRNKGIVASKNVTFNANDPTNTEDVGYGDSGSASRFFYTAKASKSERNAGLEGFEEKETKRYGDFQGTPEHAPKLDVRNTNHHPTVKPLSLTKYLATLIKPPTGGRLLVPFSGSGSEMIGALQAGWEYVEGVELTEEYIPIAEARIKHWLEQMAQEDTKPKQESLL